MPNTFTVFASLEGEYAQGFRLTGANGKPIPAVVLVWGKYNFSDNEFMPISSCVVTGPLGDYGDDCIQRIYEWNRPDRESVERKVVEMIDGGVA